jgi:hypothetical protein
MAKKQIKKYVFTPGAANVGKIIIPGYWAQDTILLVTNITRGVILYNFADTQNTGGTVTFQPGGIKTNENDYSVVTYGYDVFGNIGSAAIQTVESGTGETTLTFNTSTLGYSSADKLSILVEDKYTMVRIWGDFGTDAIERTRVASPQAMIDADFEYGLQGTKWQSVQTVANFPSIYEQVTVDLTTQSITTSGNTNSLILIQSSSHGLSIGDPVSVSLLDVSVTGFAKAEGAALVFQSNTNYFTYWAKGQVGSVDGTSIKSAISQVRKGGLYTGSDLPLSYIASDTVNPSKITLTFTGPHGFFPGMPIAVNANPAFGSNTSLQYLPGVYFVSNITANTADFTARGTVTTANIGNLFIDGNGAGIKVYVRPDGFFTHRPGEGGVIIGTNSPVHGAQAVRQSKKYFRYQSGKGFLYTTGVLFGPNYDITEVTSNGTSMNPGSEATITITTAVPHGLQLGAIIRIAGVRTDGYNGQYTVSYINSEYTVGVVGITNQDLDDTMGALGAGPKLYLYKWHGSCIRTGPHDDANGMFFEYDGQTFNVVKRTSTLQLAGTCTITSNSAKLTGLGTKWSQQLKIGDRIVLKGMVHRVSGIFSDTSVAISPEFRGVISSSGNYIWRVDELRIGQQNLNRDTVDGSGSQSNPSGYKMDPNQMQMVGIQFSWYGAGFMDFMVRGVNGDFIILHRMKNNNVNTTASMRTANLPVRYEVLNEGASGLTGISPLSGVVSDVATELPVDDVSFYPESGIVLVENEIIAYSARDTISTPKRLLGLTRAATANVYVAGDFRVFGGVPATSHAPYAGVELISQTATPNLTHWGSSYIIDGGFDLDRGYQFTYTVTNANVSSAGNTVMALRLSPSASNSQVGDLGEKELLNRAQILLQGLQVACGDQRTGGNVQILVTGVLNPSNYTETLQTWQALNTTSLGNQPSFSQTTANCWFKSQTYVGEPVIALPGEKLFEFVYDPRSRFAQDLTGIKELSQSAVGGRGTFPNGADTLYINMTALPGATTSVTGGTTTNTFISNVHVTLQWGEAQA